MSFDGAPSWAPSDMANVRLSARWEAFMLGLTLLSLANIAFVAFARLAEVGKVALTVDIAISVVFIGDFLRRLAVARNPRAYVSRGYGWLDLIGCVPGLRLVRIVRVSQALHQLGDYGGIRLVARQVFANRAQGSLLLVLLISIYVIELGSIAMLSSEANSPDANITTSSDALWYIMVTISTVGYGDLYPTTGWGRIVGIMILIVGVGLFTTLTGFLANIFLVPGQRSGQQTSFHPDSTGQPNPQALPQAQPTTTNDGAAAQSTVLPSPDP
jgi:voltage-gated potassium channel